MHWGNYGWGKSGGQLGLAFFIVIGVSLIVVLIPSCKKKETTVTKEIAPPAVGNKAPLFTLKDVSGKNANLSDYEDRIVVIDFWATWCHWCKETTQELEKIHKDYKNRDVAILGISMDTGSSAGQKVGDFARKYNLSYVMLIDDGNVSKSYEVNKIPTTFILGRDHVIQKIFPGYLPGLKERIVAEIEKSLSKS